MIDSLIGDIGRIPQNSLKNVIAIGAAEQLKPQKHTGSYQKGQEKQNGIFLILSCHHIIKLDHQDHIKIHEDEALMEHDTQCRKWQGQPFCLFVHQCHKAQ